MQKSAMSMILRSYFIIAGCWLVHDARVGRSSKFGNFLKPVKIQLFLLFYYQMVKYFSSNKDKCVKKSFSHITKKIACDLSVEIVWRGVQRIMIQQFILHKYRINGHFELKVLPTTVFEQCKNTLCSEEMRLDLQQNHKIKVYISIQQAVIVHMCKFAFFVIIS